MIIFKPSNDTTMLTPSEEYFIKNFPNKVNLFPRKTADEKTLLH